MKQPTGFRGAFRTDHGARAIYAEGAGIYRIIPAAVAAPADLQDLVSLVRWARDSDTPLVPRGAGSGMPGGNVGSGVVVDLRGFRDPPVVNAPARTARAGAGVTYRELNEAAARHGLILPPDPSSGAFCTIGGMVGTNAAGAHSYRYGAMRDWVRAVEFVTADGEVGRATRVPGPEEMQTEAERRFAAALFRDYDDHIALKLDLPLQLPKNSSGYWVPGPEDRDRSLQVLIGSEGTLAIVTRVEVLLHPVPPSPTAAIVALRSLDDLLPAIEALQPAHPSAIELLDRTFLEFVASVAPAVPRDAEAVLLADFEGDCGELPGLARDLGCDVVIARDADERRRLWDLRDRASPLLAGLPDTRRSLQVVEDGIVYRRRMAGYIRTLRETARGFGFEVVIFGHAGDGHVHANVIADVSVPDVVDRLGRLARAVYGELSLLEASPSGEHGDGRLRAPYVGLVEGAGFADYVGRVKRAWDPAGILNPGVKVPAPGARPGRFEPGELKFGAQAPPLPPEIAATLRRIEREAAWGVDRLSLIPN